MHKELPHVMSRSYVFNLVAKCALLFTLGIILTTVVLYFSVYQQLGPSYQESFRILSEFKKEILYKSIASYAFTLIVILLGIMIITLLYSHRVVGPMYRLSMFVKRVTDGDLSETAVLRRNDAVQPLADELNVLIVNYRQLINELQEQTAQLKKLADLSGCDENSDELKKVLSELGDKTREIEKKLNDSVTLS